MTTQQILVLGGGYGGAMAALRLAGKTKRLNATVTLVNALDHFVERPRLHEQATGTVLKQRPFAELLRGTRVNFVRGWVTRLNAAQRRVTVQTDAGEQLFTYDALVYALGSRVERNAVPGVDEYAFTLDPYGSQTTAALETRLNQFGDAPFEAVVVGGGPTGVEVAAQIKGVYPRSRVSLVTQGEAAAFKNDLVQKHILAALAEQNINLHEHFRVTAVTTDAVISEAEKIPADVVVWAGGFAAPPLAREAGLRVNSLNQLLVDPYLRSLSHPEIFAVGDSAEPVEEPGAPWRMSLFTAIVSGAQAADNIVALLKGQTLRPLSYAWYGQGIALGLNDAVGFPAYPADVPWRLIFRRRLAVNVRNFFVWLLGASLRAERRFPGALFWNGKKRYEYHRRHNARSDRVASQL